MIKERNSRSLRSFGTFGTIFTTIFLLTTAVSTMPMNPAFALITGQDIGSVTSTSTEQGTGTNNIAKIEAGIEQENECHNETDCDNETGTENNVNINTLPLDGIYTVVATEGDIIQSLNNDYEITAIAECNPGDVVVGGGEKLDLNYAGLIGWSSGPLPAPPSTNPNAWEVTASMEAIDATGLVVTAYAVCVDNP